MQASIVPQIRPPWPDEISRVQHFLPAAFLFDTDPFLLIAVAGRVERIVGAVGLTDRRLPQRTLTWLCLRAEPGMAYASELLEGALEEAWRRGAESVYFGQTVEENSEAAEGLRAHGFMEASVHQVYEVNSAQLWERVAGIYDRLRARNLIPSTIELTTLQPAVLWKVREFLRGNLPQSESALALESAGYKAEHSIALFVDGEIKGVLLCRRAGQTAYIGLRVVAKELRGGFGWANLLLLHASLRSGLQTGLELSRFEFNAEQHHDTKQFAETSGAHFVGRRLLLRIDRAAGKSLTT